MRLCEGPLVSVIIPARNAAGSLPRAISTVHATGYEPLEVIVCDDGSTDDTAALARQCAAFCVSQKNAGPAAARNTALRQARGDVFAFLDADDLWPARSLLRELALLRQGADMVWGLTQLMRCRGETEAPSGAPWRPPLFGSILLTRAALERVGFLHEPLREGEDVEWFVRARDRGLHIAPLDQVTLHYRVHDRNRRKSDDGSRSRGLLSGVRAALLRRREESGELPSPPR